jgi:hypothetical protein
MIGGSCGGFEKERGKLGVTTKILCILMLTKICQNVLFYGNMRSYDIYLNDRTFSDVWRGAASIFPQLRSWQNIPCGSGSCPICMSGVKNFKVLKAEAIDAGVS